MILDKLSYLRTTMADDDVNNPFVQAILRSFSTSVVAPTDSDVDQWPALIGRSEVKSLTPPKKSYEQLTTRSFSYTAT